MTLTLASAVAATDAVKVSYTKPTTGTDNRIRSASGVEADSFSNQDVSHNRAPVFTATASNPATPPPTRLRPS